VSALKGNLTEVQELCATSLQIVGATPAADNAEDHSASLLAAKEELQIQLKAGESTVEHHQDTLKSLMGECELQQKQIAELDLALNDAPVAKQQMMAKITTLTSETEVAVAKIAKLDTEIAEVAAELQEAEKLKKKAAKKDARVTSLVETLATMIEMEDESQKKQDELSAMGEQMKSMMEEMAKRQKMMQTMMTQVMAGIGGLDGEDNGDDDDIDPDVNVTQTVEEKSAEQRKNIQMLQDRVNSLLGEVKAANTEQAAKIVQLNGKHQELVKEKTACELQIASNNQQIEQANKDLESPDHRRYSKKRKQMQLKRCK